MLKITRIGSLVAVAAAGALVLSACGNSSSDPTPSATGASTTAKAGGGIVSAWGSEPQNPLIPTNTTEVGGGKIIDLMFSGLVSYDAEGKPVNEVAKSIESTDGQNYTITLNSGWKFTNGEPVIAQNFVDAWNFGALLSNGQSNSYFFDPIEGFADVQACEEGKGPKDADGNATCLPTPKADTMSGLKVVDDSTFTVKLVSPQADFPLRLGYSAFYPLPKAGLADLKAFGQMPIGNGPYKFASDKAWEHNTKLDLIPNPDYTGPRKPKNAGVSIKFYESLDAAYIDLQSGELDVLDSIPDSQYGSYESDLGDRAVNQPAAIFQSFTIPSKLKHFTGEEGQLRRAAISHAINREEITQAIFQGTRTPAKDFTSPVINGWSESVPGSDVLTFDEAKAKDLWAQADKISPWDGTFTIGFNADGGHQAWVEAVTGSIKNTLGIDAEPNAIPLFADFRQQISKGTIKGAFRTGWQADYPSLYNFLAPLYQTGAGSNDGKYSSKDFDAKLAEGAAEPSVEEANAKFQEAQTILFKDLPAIPLWYSNVTGGSSEKVKNVKFGWNSVPLLYDVTKD